MAKPGLDKASRQAAAKAGAALPNGKYPIRNKRELKAAIKLRHHSTEKASVVSAHILRRAAALGIPIKASRVASATPYEDFARSRRDQAKRRASSKSIKGRDPSLRWPHLYDILRAKGYDKEKAARISNSRLRFRKKGRLEGLPWKKADNKKELKKLLASSALVAACHSAACAPPPVGTGGSRGAALSQASRTKALLKGGHAARNTSVYPVDTIKTTRAGDQHPLAPGTSDRSAVRGHKGVHGTDPERRIPRAGETVDVYRDLGHGKAHKRGFPDDMAFSVRHASGMPGEQSGLVVASTTGVILNNGRPSWAHSAKADLEGRGKRGVHGFIRGEVQEYVNPERLAATVKNNPEWVKVTYYPGAQDFFDPKTRDRFVGSDQVALVNGEFFAKNPQFVTGNPAIVSPIERKVMGLTASAIDFACYDKSCAPPPVGVGGSKEKSGGKSKGWEKQPWGTTWYKGDYVIEKASGMGLGGSHSVFHTGTEKTDEYRNSIRGRPAKKLGSPSTLEQAKQLADAHAEKNQTFPHITAAEARGDSKPVSAAEFQALAQKGQEKLDRLASNASPAKGLDDNWDSVKSSAYDEATQSWGGATIDAHTGVPVAQGANRFALTIKDKGKETVSIPEGASREEFDAAMEIARERFRPILEREGSHLGVFHDDDLKRIDIDPVLVVDTLDDVHTIGAATRAIGGAYNFADGNGYWPPHVAEGK
jgi:hypothetical protein